MELQTSPKFVDKLEYHKETDLPCPKCGTKLLADDLGGFYLKCRCGWKGY